MEKQLFFTSGVETHHKQEDMLIYEPFWQLGIVEDDRERMKRLERLLGVQPSTNEQDKIIRAQDEQKQAVQETLIKGTVTAWVGPSASEELAFMELAETLSAVEQLRLRIIPGPLQLRERAPDLFVELENHASLTIPEWQEQITLFSSIEKGLLLERGEPFQPIAREDTYFDAEILALLSFQEMPISRAKLAAEAYAKRPDFPVPFYLHRVNELIQSSDIHSVADGLVLNKRFE